MLRFNIKYVNVVVMQSLMLMEYIIKAVTIRNDNRSQFIIGVVRHFLNEKIIKQHFTHIANSEENAYHEAINSNFDREAVEPFE